jgi:hypothetical protein
MCPRISRSINFKQRVRLTLVVEIIVLSCHLIHLDIFFLYMAYVVNKSLVWHQHFFFSFFSLLLEIHAWPFQICRLALKFPLSLYLVFILFFSLFLNYFKLETIFNFILQFFLSHWFSPHFFYCYFLFEMISKIDFFIISSYIFFLFGLIIVLFIAIFLLW